MTTYETIASREIKYENRSFIEVARKIARDGDRTTGEGNEFLMISRGSTSEDGGRKYRNHFTMPYRADLADSVCAALVEVATAKD